MPARRLAALLLPLALVVAATTIATPAAAAATASVSGTVTGVGGAPLPNVTVSVVGVFGSAGGTITDGSGNYTIGALNPGSYTVHFETNETGDTFYGDEWLGDQYEQSQATYFSVADGETITGKDAEIGQGGTLVGNIKGAGSPAVNLANLDVSVYRNGVYVFTGIPGLKTDVNGNFQISGLPGGTYTFGTQSPNSGWASAYFGGASVLAQGTTFTITPGATTSVKNLVLPIAGTIAGRVTGTGGAGLANASVSVYQPAVSTEPVGYLETDGSGNYLMEGLAAGDFRLAFSGPYGVGYVTEYWNNQSSLAASTPVNLAAGQHLTGYDASLVMGASISGTTTEAISGDPLEAHVTLLDAQGNEIASTDSDSDGLYTLPGAPVGSLTLRFTASGYAPTSAPVTVASAAALPGYDAELEVGSTISGVVSVQPGDSAGPFTAKLYRTGGSGPSVATYVATAVAGFDQSFTFTDVPVGTFTIGFAVHDAGSDRSTLPASGLGYTTGWLGGTSYATAEQVVIEAPGDAITGLSYDFVYPHFADVPDPASPFYTAIEWMAQANISTGTAQPMPAKPLYKPSATVSRQAMAAFLLRLSGESFVPPAEPTFADVDATSQFYTAVEWMADRAISTGTVQPTGKPLFKPSDSVSRQAMALFLARYAGADLSAQPTVQSFADVPLDSSPAAAIAWMADNGISTGTAQPSGLPLYKPSDGVSRQAMALFLYRMPTGEV